MKSLMASPPTSWQKGSKGDIVLIPGFGCSWTFFEYLADSLNKTGYRIHVVRRFEHTAMAMEKYCQVLHTYLVEHKLKNVIFLCHSRGGKVSKYFSATYPNNKPVKAIHIASKYTGSFWARLKIFNLDEFDQNSKVLKIINSNIDNKHILNLYPTYDNIFFSSPSEKLSNAINIQIMIVGHTRILFDKETLNQILRFFYEGSDQLKLRR